MSLEKDIGFYINSVFGLSPQTVSAGGANDNAAINGVRVTNSDGHKSLVTALLVDPTISAGETVDVTIQLQDSPDGGATWNNYGDAFTTQLDENAGVQVLEIERIIDEADLDFRVQVTLNFSDDGTAGDTADVAAAHVLGPGQQLPA